jgi:hypothetical protein
MRSWSWFCVRVVLAGVASAGAVLVCGCHKTVMVFGPSALPDALAPNATDMQREKAAAKELPGIPFYNHYGICTQETVWLEPQTTLTLTVTPEKEKPVIQTMTLNNRAFHDTYVDPNLDPSILVKQLEALKGDHQIVDSDSPYCPSRVAGNWQAIKDKYKVVAIDDTTDIYNAKKALYLVPVTNTADIGTAVDYSRVYYLNARSPLNGTSTVDAKLNVDGTLGEGSATTDNETLSAVLTTLGTLGSGALTAWSTIDAASITGNATVNAAAAAALAPAGAMKVQSIDGKPPKQYVCALVVADGHAGWAFDGFGGDELFGVAVELVDAVDHGGAVDGFGGVGGVVGARSSTGGAGLPRGSGRWRGPGCRRRG